MGAWFDDECSGSYAHPERSRGGMCVHENKWLDDDRPEWPEAASGTRENPAAGERTQAFPETRGTEVLASGKSEAGPEALPEALPEVLPGALPGALSKAGPDDPAFPDPWGAGRDGDDPHEVTVQLDAVGSRADGASDSAGAQGTDGPVFVDESGRRSRRYRRIGIAVGTGCAVYAVVIVVTLLSGNSNAPWLPVPGRGDGKEAGQVENTPLPRDTALPTGGGAVVPPAVSPGTTPSPAASATRPSASATAKPPGTSVSPRPTATRTTPGPGGDPTPLPSQTPDPPTSVTPAPSPSVTSPGPSDPPPDPGSGDGGTGTVADGTNANPPGDTATQPAGTTL